MNCPGAETDHVGLAYERFYEVDRGTFFEIVRRVHEDNAEKVGGMAAIETVAR